MVSFVNPLSPTQMLTGKETVISTQYHQVRVGGDIAAITGLCKCIIEADDAARGGPRGGRPPRLPSSYRDFLYSLVAISKISSGA